jgi:NAD(P)-dependent dehydrogenase (short-subunit alcohol dehydrogenase family)
MRVLVLGGTAFVGRHLVEEALRRGHTVTTFNRGRTAPDQPGVEAVHGDRTTPDGLDRLRGREWDAVVDTSGFVPRVVRDTTRAMGAHHLWDASSARAEAAGLRCRPVIETLHDTWAWLEQEEPLPPPRGLPVVGLPVEKERAVLAAAGGAP